MEQQIIISKKMLSMAKIIRSFFFDEKTLYFKKEVVELMKFFSKEKTEYLFEFILSVWELKRAKIEIEESANGLAGAEPDSNMRINFCIKIGKYQKTVSIVKNILDYIKEIKIMLEKENANDPENLKKIEELKKYEAGFENILFGSPSKD